MIVERTKNRESIWAEIISSCSGGTGEWDSECKVYYGKQQIGYLDETIASEHLCIRGIFDYKEDGTKDDDGIPNIFDDALYLSIEDLTTLKEIIEHWNDCDKYAEKWEKVDSEDE